MNNISILFIGFSVISAAVLMLSHFNKKNYQQRLDTVIFGIALVAFLSVLQLYNFAYIQNGFPLFESKIYLASLLIIAPCFYLFSRRLLVPNEQRHTFIALHFLPLTLVFLIDARLLFTLAFIIGSAYLLWLIISLYKLRKYSNQFILEIIIFSIVFIIAAVVSVLALTMPFTQLLFFQLYSIAIGLAFFLVQLVLGYAPGISENVSMAATEAYAKTTLKGIDCEVKINQLESLIKDDLYQQSNLDLFTVASELQLTSHQLSELINSRLGKSFSRYLREIRVQVAKNMLIEKPALSVLEVGLESGFSSQSNFYNAFKEITGSTPAKYRKLKDPGKSVN